MSPYSRQLLIAFAASLGIHAIFIEVWAVTATLNLITGTTKKIEVPKQEIPVLTLLEPKRPPRPTTFVETDQTQQSTHPPKQSQFYSDRSTSAANPKPDLNAAKDKPKLDGKDARVPSTENVPMSQPASAGNQALAQKNEAPHDWNKMTPPAPEEKPVSQPNRQAVGEKKTEVSMITKQPDVTKNELAQAKQTPPQPDRIIPEARSKSDSSVSREGIRAFDVTGTQFGAYDRKVFAAIKYRWLALIEQYTIPGERAGQVMVRCHLNEDGTVSELTVAENTAGDILSLYCQKAITDSAPFGRWPEELKALVTRNYREMVITFYY